VRFRAASAVPIILIVPLPKILVYDKLETHAFNIKMNAIPCYYEAAKELEKSYLREHTALAISQNLGGIAI
jgi:hypothetical protein